MLKIALIIIVSLLNLISVYAEKIEKKLYDFVEKPQELDYSYTMKKLYLYIFVILMWCSVGFAIENWKIEQRINNKFTEVSTNGIVTDGDRYRLHISNNGKCNTVEDGFTFYTRTNHPDISSIVGKKVLLEAMGSKMLSDVKAVYPAMGGHLVWLSNGLYKLEEHAKFLEDKKILEVKLLAVYSDYENNTGWNAEDMFDILFNSWDLTNVYDALMQGKKNCLENS